MDPISTLVVAAAVAIAFVSFTQFIVLVFRNPLRPQWLRINALYSPVIIAVIATGVLVFAGLVAALAGAGLHVLAALAAALVLMIAVTVANARIFGIRERLERADAGASPFYAHSARHSGVELPK
jgi:hypothetical protein